MSALPTPNQGGQHPIVIITSLIGSLVCKEFLDHPKLCLQQNYALLLYVETALFYDPDRQPKQLFVFKGCGYLRPIKHPRISLRKQE